MIHKSDLCGFCGACVAVCSKKVLDLEENIIIINSGCTECGDCQKVCPLGALRGGDADEV